MAFILSSLSLTPNAPGLPHTINENTENDLVDGGEDSAAKASEKLSGLALVDVGELSVVVDSESVVEFIVDVEVEVDV